MSHVRNNLKSKDLAESLMTRTGAGLLLLLSALVLYLLALDRFGLLGLAVNALKRQGDSWRTYQIARSGVPPSSFLESPVYWIVFAFWFCTLLVAMRAAIQIRTVRQLSRISFASSIIVAWAVFFYALKPFENPISDFWLAVTSTGLLGLVSIWAMRPIVCSEGKLPPARLR